MLVGFMHDEEGCLTAEVNPNGSLRSHFLYASESHSPDYMIRGGVSYYFAKDHRGSIRSVINAGTGVVEQSLHYDEFGRVLSDTNPGFQPFGFAGGHYDHQTGLVRFGARDYDAETGRWASKDPILFEGGDANVYNYVMNDPVNWIDPGGLKRLPMFEPDTERVPMPLEARKEASATFTDLEKRDAYRHCLASCYATVGMGAAAANILGIGVELSHVGSLKSTKQDLLNNRCGSIFGERTSTRNGCQDQCYAAVNSGELKIGDMN